MKSIGAVIRFLFQIVLAVPLIGLAIYFFTTPLEPGLEQYLLIFSLGMYCLFWLGSWFNVVFIVSILEQIGFCLLNFLPILLGIAKLDLILSQALLDLTKLIVNLTNSYQRVPFTVVGLLLVTCVAVFCAISLVNGFRHWQKSRSQPAPPATK